MTESFLDCIPDDRPVAIILRHAERPDLPPGSIGENLRLTDAGVESSRLLGQLLKGRVLSVASSPVLRCRQTADEIVEGLSCSVSVTNSAMLGDPGVFVVDGDKAFENWGRLGNMGVIRHLSTSDEVLPGMRPVEEATRMMIDWVSEYLVGSKGLHLFVTHDAVLAPFSARVTGNYSEEIHYPNFLKGMALWRNQDGSLGFIY